MRYAALISYKGSNYSGAQKVTSSTQKNIAGLLESALAKIANHSVKVSFAGRTDKGVHALQQIIHFDTTTRRREIMWQQGANRWLPQDIRIHWVLPVSDDFHSRFSAQSRRYCYLISTSESVDAITNELCYSFTRKLDIAAMKSACEGISGEYDCAALRSNKCGSPSSHRHIDWVRIACQPPWITIDIQANAFLNRMVRIIVGELIGIGEGENSPDYLRQLLVMGKARATKKIAPAHGLYLTQINYATGWNFPIELADKLWCMRLAKVGSFTDSYGNESTK